MVVRSLRAGTVLGQRSVDEIQLWCGRAHESVRVRRLDLGRQPVAGREDGHQHIRPAGARSGRDRNDQTFRITPGDPGTKVTGFLTVESFNFNTLSSDEVASFPYSYKVVGKKGH